MLKEVISLKENNSQDKKRVVVLVNRNIRAPRVRCINQENENIGVLSLNEALSLATAAGLDLVQVSPPSKDTPPVCRILDSGKYKYDLSKKLKEADKKQREAQVKVKEIQFRPNTGDHDLETKAKKVEEFLAENCKVKVTMRFVGREHQSVGIETLQKFVQMVATAELEGEPEVDRKEIRLFLKKK